MVHTKLTVGKPYLKGDRVCSADVSGIIGFSGEAAGCVVISFASEVACKAASKFACTEIDAKHPDFADAIGELANMVAGNAKKEFTDLNIQISLPSVVIGEQFVVSNSNTTPRIIIPCSSELGEIIVEVAMELGDKKQNSSTATAAVAGVTP